MQSGGPERIVCSVDWLIASLNTTAKWCLFSIELLVFLNVLNVLKMIVFSSKVRLQVHRLSLRSQKTSFESPVSSLLIHPFSSVSHRLLSLFFQSIIRLFGWSTHIEELKEANCPALIIPHSFSPYVFCESVQPRNSQNVQSGQLGSSENLKKEEIAPVPNSFSRKTNRISRLFYLFRRFLALRPSNSQFFVCSVPTKCSEEPEHSSGFCHFSYQSLPLVRAIELWKLILMFLVTSDLSVPCFVRNFFCISKQSHAFFWIISISLFSNFRIFSSPEKDTRMQKTRVTTIEQWTYKNYFSEDVKRFSQTWSTPHFSFLICHLLNGSIVYNSCFQPPLGYFSQCNSARVPLFFSQTATRSHLHKHSSSSPDYFPFESPAISAKIVLRVLWMQQNSSHPRAFRKREEPPETRRHSSVVCFSFLRHLFFLDALGRCEIEMKSVRVDGRTTWHDSLRSHQCEISTAITKRLISVD